jgi:hypothetical protein
MIISKFFKSFGQNLILPVTIFLPLRIETQSLALSCDLPKRSSLMADALSRIHPYPLPAFLDTCSCILMVFG